VKAGIASVTACFEAKETGGALLRQILPLAGDAAVAQDGAGGRLRRLGGRFHKRTFADDLRHRQFLREYRSINL
jgi:hypothetical protein